MNTPSHAIVNLAVLLSPVPEAAMPILLGSVLPDLPMFVLYVWAKSQKIPEQTVWTEIYWQPFWQNFTHGFHSIPLAAIAALICHWQGWLWLELLSWSAVLHSLGDFPVHHDDAHRHFLPFSQYRFISPISYWDRRHYGSIVSFGERLLVLGTSICLFPFFESWIARGLLIAVNALYWFGYLYSLRRCNQFQAKA